MGWGGSDSPLSPEAPVLELDGEGEEERPIIVIAVGSRRLALVPQSKTCACYWPESSAQPDWSISATAAYTRSRQAFIPSAGFPKTHIHIRIHGGEKNAIGDISARNPADNCGKPGDSHGAATFLLLPPGERKRSKSGEQLEWAGSPTRPRRKQARAGTEETTAEEAEKAGTAAGEARAQDTGDQDDSGTEDFSSSREGPSY